MRGSLRRGIVGLLSSDHAHPPHEIADSPGDPPGLDPLLLTGRGITLGSISVGSRADFEALNRAIAMHRLHPVIDRTFPFTEAKEAYRHFEGRGHFGKVVITHA
jgi:NADPH:quinone reductase-like Zn-dependent oxidoreductase